MKPGDTFYLLIGEERTPAGIAGPDSGSPEYDTLVFTAAFTTAKKAEQAAQQHCKQDLEWRRTSLFQPEISAQVDNLVYTIRKKVLE